jgi:hypothetical protein
MSPTIQSQVSTRLQQRSRAEGGLQLEIQQLGTAFTNACGSYVRNRNADLWPRWPMLATRSRLLWCSSSSSQHVVTDGYKRIRGLRRRHRDTSEAISSPALISTRLMHFVSDGEPRVEHIPSAWVEGRAKTDPGLARVSGCGARSDDR